MYNKLHIALCVLLGTSSANFGMENSLEVASPRKTPRREKIVLEPETLPLPSPRPSPRTINNGEFANIIPNYIQTQIQMMTPTSDEKPAETFNSNSRETFDTHQVDKKQLAHMAELGIDLTKLSPRKITITGLEHAQTSPQLSPRKSQSGNQPNSPRDKQSINKKSLLKLQHNNAYASFTSFTNDVCRGSSFSTIAEMNDTHSIIDFHTHCWNDCFNDRTDIKSITIPLGKPFFSSLLAEHKGEDFILIEYYTTISQQKFVIKVDDLLNFKNSDNKTEEIQKTSTLQNIEEVNDSFRKKTQQTFIKRIIGWGTFTAIVVAILYKYNKLPDAFIDAFNKILPRGYAL